MRRPAVALVAVVVLLALADRASGHDGPPFPIVMERAAGPYTISVWTDPDVGIGKFFVIFATKPGAPAPNVKEVTVCVRPQSNRIPERCYAAARQEASDRIQYYAEVDFDRQEIWQVRVNVRGPDGDAEVTADVEATPPGFGAWDMLFYGFPFLLFGGLWAYVALRRGHRARQASSLPGPAATPRSATESC
jgi:hypothetical protein